MPDAVDRGPREAGAVSRGAPTRRSAARRRRPARSRLDGRCAAASSMLGVGRRVPRCSRSGSRGSRTRAARSGCSGASGPSSQSNSAPDRRRDRAGRAGRDRAHRRASASTRSSSRARRSGQLRKGPGHVVGSSLPGPARQRGDRRAAHAVRRPVPPSRLAARGRRISVDDRPGTRDLPCRERRHGLGAGDGSCSCDHGDNRLTLFTADSACRGEPAPRRHCDARRRCRSRRPSCGARSTPTASASPASAAPSPTVLVWLELLLVVALLAAFALTRWSTRHDVGRVRAGARAPHVDGLRERRASAARDALSRGSSEKSFRLQVAVVWPMLDVHLACD